MFCLGSQDYLVLESFSRTPSVFFDQDMTEIPQLREHLIAVGERRRKAWATDLFQRLEKFSENIHSYFSEGKHPGRLHQENKTKALALIDDLEKANLQAAKDAFDAVEQELNRIKEELQDATQQAATSSPQVMSRFSNMHWNTYKACMRFNGVYFAHDMNRDLTQKILPAIRGSWNGGINHRIPRIIRDTTLDLEENTLEKITEIISALTGKGTALKQPIDAARDSIGVEGLFSDMLTDAIEKITVAQRDGTRSFNTVLQQEMTPQYQHSFQQSGTGAFARMKTSNVSHLEEHGEAVFHSINMHIEKLLDDALAKVKHEFRTELHNLGILLRSSFVEKVDLSKDHQKVKDQIIQLTLEKRPAIATWKLDLSHQQHRSGAESKQ
ncbi:hypothetical protein K438DRAFT_610937 [Mycena galopus ATCC 62051]|nr:hypothetical protein K438DRAFT_610937 [Mycena galopus ATCC 62051]